MESDKRRAEESGRTATEQARHWSNRYMIRHDFAFSLQAPFEEAFLAGYEAGQRSNLPLTTSALSEARGIASRLGERSSDKE